MAWETRVGQSGVVGFLSGPVYFGFQGRCDVFCKPMVGGNCRDCCRIWVCCTTLSFVDHVLCKMCWLSSRI